MVGELAAPPGVTAQDFLSVPKSYALPFLIPAHCLKSPCHSNLLWKLKWVSGVPLDKSQLYSSFNQVVAGVHRQKKYSPLEMPLGRTCSNWCALRSRGKPQEVYANFDNVGKSSVFRGHIPTPAFQSGIAQRFTKASVLLELLGIRRQG